MTKPNRKHTIMVSSTVYGMDLRLLDLYEKAILDAIPLSEREGNWVQKFRSTEDGSLFVTAQFFRYQEVEQFIEENFKSGVPLSKKGGEA